MDYQNQEDPDKKSKKKKHNRSRSRSQHKKYKRSRSRSQRKRDKKKKDKSSYDRHHKNRSNQKQLDKQIVQGSKQVDKEKQKELYKQKDKPRQKQGKVKDNKIGKQSSQQRSQRKKDKHQRSERKDRQRDERKEKQRQERRQKDRDRDQRKDKQRDQRKEKQRQQKKEKQKQRQKQRQKQKEKEQQKEKQKEKQKEQPKDKDKQRQSRFDKVQKYAVDKNDKDRDRDRDIDRNHGRDRDVKQRQRQRFRQKERSTQRRSRQRSPQKRGDRYNGRRRENSRDYRDERKRNNGGDKRRQSRFDAPRFRFDSPPKSDESDMSDDPQKMQKLNRMKAQKQLVTSKADRKLYLGNLPPNITSQQLMDMLNAALKKMQINTQTEGDSIISAWISPDGVGHYAFVEFRTAQQATNGLTLNGASLFGYQLKLGRPKQYIEYNKQLLSQFGTDSNIDTILKKVQALGGDVKLQITERIIYPPSQVIILKHIVTVQQLAIDQQYEQIYEDVMDMAKRYGDVVNLVVPRPHQVIDLQEVQKRVKGLGYIFIEYKSVQQAVFARKKIVQKQFSNRSVACSFFEVQRFRQAEYDICQKVTIDF